MIGNNINSFDVSPQVKPIRDTWIESVNDMEYEFTLLKTNKSIILTAPLSDTRKEMYYQNIQEILNTLDTWSKISGSIKNNKLYL